MKKNDFYQKVSMNRDISCKAKWIIIHNHEDACVTISEKWGEQWFQGPPTANERMDFGFFPTYPMHVEHPHTLDGGGALNSSMKHLFVSWFLTTSLTCLPPQKSFRFDHFFHEKVWLWLHAWFQSWHRWTVYIKLIDINIALSK